jgi:hypothetical protein
MGCCGMFSKSSKKTAAGGANGFAPRPVQQTGYAPTAAALDNQKKYNSEFRKQYGGDPNDPEFLKSLAANQALAGSATDCEFLPSFPFFLFKRFCDGCLVIGLGRLVVVGIPAANMVDV